MANQTYPWQQFYESQTLNDTGITSPDGYNLYPDPTVPYVLSASELQSGAVAPLYRNPAAMLYASGTENRVLLNASREQCNTGCLTTVYKPDPRVRQVKPLYTPTTFKASGNRPLPTSYNVVGMY